MRRRLTLSLSEPFLQNLFHFSVPHIADLAICVGAGIVGILCFETIKWLHWHRKERAKT